MTVLRSVAGLTQQQLAKLIPCSRMSIQAIESGKLGLSQRMAEKCAAQTGVSMKWLLENRHKVPPTCERDPERPYTRDIYRMTRAEVTEPRDDPLDVRAIQNSLALAYARLDGAARQAYLAKEIIHFNYSLKEFLEGLGRRWPDSGTLPKSMNVAQYVLGAGALWESARKQKRRPKPRK